MSKLKKQLFCFAMVCFSAWLPSNHAYAGTLSSSPTTTLSCAHDFNNDGDLTQAGELGTCILDDAGNPFCPLAPAECVVVQTNPACPSGTTLNATTHHCESDPTCSSGVYTSNSKTCLLFTPAICPAGSDLNEHVNKCQDDPTCSFGTFDIVQHRCVETTDRACSSSTVLNPVTNKCEAVPVCAQGKGTYNQTYNACVFTGSATPTCPTGSMLNTTTNRCEAPPKCNNGGVFDSSSNMCLDSAVTTNATCPQNTTLNMNVDVCQGTASCTPDTTYDTVNKMCVATPQCPTGWKYSTSLHMCTLSGTAALLTTVPGVYNGYGELPCHGNTNNGHVDTCTPLLQTQEAEQRVYDIFNSLGIGAHCPAGSTIDQTSLKCAIHPECPIGTTFALETNTCTATPFCVAGIFDISLDKCVVVYNGTGTPICPAGTAILDNSSNECVSSAQCVAGTLFNPATNKCETPIGCPSGTYDIALNYCVLHATPSCATGTTFNPTTQKCEKAVSCPSGSTYNSASKKCDYGNAVPLATCPSNDPCPVGVIAEYIPDVLHFAACNASSPYYVSNGWLSGSMCYINVSGTEDAYALDPGLGYPWTLTGLGWNIGWGIVGWGMGKFTYVAPASCPAYHTQSGGYCYPFPPVAVICPSGTTFDSTTNLCTGAPFCGIGASYDPVSQSCNTIVNPLCVTGTNMNTTTDLCEAAPTCLQGFGFNPASHRCEALPTCAFGFTYDPVNHICAQNSTITDAVCPANSALSDVIHECVGTFQCPTGGTYNPATFQCEATPTCALGTLKYITGPGVTALAIAASTSLPAYCKDPPSITLPECNPTLPAICSIPGNSKLHQCDVPNGFANDLPAAYQFPYCDIPASTQNTVCVAGTTLDIEINKCDATVKCPASTFFNPYDQFCEANPVCPLNAIYYPSFGTCVKYVNSSPTCPDSSLSFNGQLDLCVKAPNCPSGSYDPVTKICTINNITPPTCPAGTTCDGTVGKCTGNPQCLNGGSWDTTLNTCVRKTPATCVPSTSLNNTDNLCESIPTCSANAGAYASSAKQCVLDTAAICPATFALDRTTDKCSAIPSCSSGNFDPGTNICQGTGGAPTSATCPANTTLKVVTNKCTASPTCIDGVYNSYLAKCRVNVTCSAGAYNMTTSVCDTGPGTSVPPTCPSDMTLDTLNGACVVTATCPTGTSLDSGTGLCLADPACSPGVYDPSIAQCVPFLKTCPYDTPAVAKTSTPAKTYACPLVGGVQTCSADLCSDGTTTTPPPGNNIIDDGDKGPNGECLGQVRIFNGESERCRPPGQRTMTANCCDMPISTEDYDANVNPYYRFERTVLDPLGILNDNELVGLSDEWNIWSGGCVQSEFLLFVENHDKKTHFVGEYCIEKWVAWCVQKGKVYCAFHSTIARIIQEQGRLQLKRFQPNGNWGTPELPNCEGFKIEEFQMLDFSKIDMSEFVELMKERIQRNLANAAASKAGSFYDITLPAIVSGSTPSLASGGTGTNY